MPGNPNRKCRLEPLNPVERNLGSTASGDVVYDGYTTIARRPRYHNADIVDVDQADRINRIVSDFDFDDY